MHTFKEHVQCIMRLPQVDAHLTSFIADLKLRQVDPLAIPPTPTTTHASIQQHSRLAALMLPLTVPDSKSEQSESEQASTGAHSSQAAVSLPEPLQSPSADCQLAETTVEMASTGRTSQFTNVFMAWVNWCTTYLAASQVYVSV